MSIGIIREFFDFEDTRLKLDADPFNHLGNTGSRAFIVTAPSPPFGTYTLKLQQHKTESYFRTPLYTYTSGTKTITACYVRVQDPPGGYPMPQNVPALIRAINENGKDYWNIEFSVDGFILLTDASGTLLHNGFISTDRWHRVEVLWNPGNSSSDWALYISTPRTSSLLIGSGTGASFALPGTDVGLFLGGQGGNPLAQPINVYHGGSYAMENINDINDRIGKSEGRVGDWISIIDGGKPSKNSITPDCSESGTIPGDNLTTGLWSNAGDDNSSTSGMYDRASASPALGGGVRLVAPKSNSIDNIYASKWIWFGSVNATDGFKAVYGKYNLTTGYDVTYEIAGSIAGPPRYYRHIEDAPSSKSPDIDELYVIGMRNDITFGRTSRETIFYEGWCYSLHSAPLTYLPQEDNNISLYISAGFLQNNCDLFINGSQSISNSGNLFIGGYATHENDVDLYTKGHLESSGNISLYTKSFDSISGNSSLFMYGGHDLWLFTIGGTWASSSINLYEHGFATESNNCNLFIYGGHDLWLFIEGLGQQTGITPLYTTGHLESSGSIAMYTSGAVTIPFIQVSGDIPLYTHGHLSSDNDCDLFINGYDIISEDISLYVAGHIRQDNSVPLFINSHSFITNNSDLFINGHSLSSGNFPCYTQGGGTMFYNTDLFIGGLLSKSDNVDLYIYGAQPISNSVTLYTIGSGIIDHTGTIYLFINGYEPVPALSCPVLDPTASIQITDKIIKIYQNSIDSLINQLGKNTTLIFQPQIVSCPNCLYDAQGKQSTGVYNIGGPRPFARGRKCPYCKGAGTLKTESEQCIKCLVKWNPRDLEDYGISIENTDNVVRLKTYITHMDDLMRADSAIVLRDSIGITKLKTRRIISPVPVGLRYDRYCISFWEVDNG